MFARLQFVCLDRPTERSCKVECWSVDISRQRNAYIKTCINFTEKCGGEREYYSDILKLQQPFRSPMKKCDIEKREEMKTARIQIARTQSAAYT
jgi:hypothetical protein